MTKPNPFSWFRSCWRQTLVVLTVVGPLALLLVLPPIRQPQEYYAFADQRAFFHLPNFSAVASNLAFLLVGIAGLRFCLRNRWDGMRSAWIVVFAGLIAVSLGSGYFHWNPGAGTLVWDRLAMTLSFTGLFVAILGEHISVRLGRFLLVPALFLGIASVLCWHWFDDLRFYAWVQFMPLLAIPVVMVLFRSAYSHRGCYVAALGGYLLAKLAELYDRELFLVTGRLISGHVLKHFLAALACFALVLMLKKRHCST